MNQLPGGLWPVMLTPFKENGAIDFGALEALTEFYIANGASGLFTNCLSSEMFQLSPEERISLTKAVVNYAANRLPVISTGTFTPDHKENVDFISRIYDQGVAGVVINTNQLCGETDGEDVFISQLENLIENTDEIPLGIYECPLPHKRLPTIDALAWMAASGRFSYFKDTCCDNRQIRERLAVTEKSPLALYNANTPTAAQSLRDGAAGISPIGANFFPELYSYLYRNVQKEETVVFTKVSQFLTSNDSVVHSLYPFSAKWFLQQRGLPISTYTRVRVPRAQYEEMNRLKELLTGIGALLEILNP